jgi:hypothetical protein
MAVEGPPIFVLGCQRSGTSLMRRLLDSHSRIACPPESGFLVQLAGVYEIERSRECLGTMGFASDEILGQMRSFAEHFLAGYARSKGKPRWADKTPHYLNHAETIDLVFNGEALYVGIVRNGLDVACSLSGFDWGVLRPYLSEGTDRRLAALRFWRDQNRKLIRMRERVGERFHLLRYEDLTRNPANVLPSVFGFLGEPWEEAVLSYNDFEHDIGFEDPKVRTYRGIKPNSGKYLDLPKDLQHELYVEGREVMEYFGYTLQGLES